MAQDIMMYLVGAPVAVLVGFLVHSAWRAYRSDADESGMVRASLGSAAGAAAASIVWFLIDWGPAPFRYGVSGLLIVGATVLGVTGMPHAKVRGAAIYLSGAALIAALILTMSHVFMAILVGAGVGLGTAKFNALPPHRFAGYVAALTTFAVIVGLAWSFPPEDAAGWMQGYDRWLWLIRILVLAGLTFTAWKLGGQNLDSGTATPKDRLLEYRNDGNRVALVFVHGFLGNASDTWSSLANALMQDPRVDDWDIYSFGYPTSLNLDMAWRWTADPDLYTVTKKLRTEAISSRKLRRYDRFAIAAHSMGGLVTQRALLDDEDFRSLIDLVMLFGTPSNGRSAGLGDAFKRQVAQMEPDSEFIKSLRSGWQKLWSNGNPGFRFYSIAGAEDNFIPTSTSLDPFPEECHRVVAGDHLSMVEADGPDDDIVQLIVGMLRGEGEDSLPWNGAQLAIERGDFQEAIQTFEPHVAELDAHALGRLALAYAATDQADKAIALLEEHGQKGGTDAMGILAGQLKRRWVVDRKTDDAVRARALYQQAFDLASDGDDHDQAYYHAINLAFMALAYERDGETAAAHARKALDHCAQAGRSVWRSATEAEAQLYLGDRRAAFEEYEKVLSTAGDALTPRTVRSMYRQAQAIADFLGDRAMTRGLDDIFKQNV